MSWWSSAVEGVKTASSKLGSGVKWAWDTLSFIPIHVAKFSLNIVYYSLTYIIAGFAAFPDLKNNPKQRQIANGIGHITFYNVLPTMLIYGANNYIQESLRYEKTEDSWLIPYALGMATLTFLDAYVKLLCFTQASVAKFQTGVLIANAGSALNSHKPPTKSELCIENKCSEKRYIKSVGMEPLIVALGDGAIFLISCIPRVGEPLAIAVSIPMKGRYITRIVTPERCGRDKGMSIASVSSIGLWSEGILFLVNKLLHNSVGPIPLFYLNIISNLLLLIHISIAAHLDIPLIKPQKDSWPNPFDIYEKMCQFVADWVFAGGMKVIPIYFKPDPNAPPIIPLVPTLQFFTKLFNHDLNTVNPVSTPTRVEKVKALAKMWLIKIWLIPRSFQSVHGLTNDAVFAGYWDTLRSAIITGTTAVEAIGKSRAVDALAWAPKTVASAVHLKFGIPKKITLLVLMLTQEKDFWEFMAALRGWFQRHGVDVDINIAPKPLLAALNGSTKLLPVPPPSAEQVATNSGQDLVPAKPLVTKMVSADDLVPRRNPVSTRRHAFFNTNQKDFNAEDLLVPRRRIAQNGAMGNG